MAEQTRLRLIQALYQLEMNAAEEGEEADVEEAIRQFGAHPLDGAALDERERERFAWQLREASGKLAVIDARLEGFLAQGWRVARLDCVLRALLRAALYEAYFSPLTPAPDILRAYGRLAGGFFSGGQRAMVHGIVERALRERGRGDQPLEGLAEALPNTSQEVM